MHFDFFISYSRADLDKAKMIKSAFEDAGYQVWIDEKLQSGERFSNVIEEQIRQVTKVVVLWSFNSIQSKWVLAEAGLALELDKYLPIRLDNCDLPLLFRSIHAASIEEKGMGELIRELRTSSDFFQVGKADVMLARLPISEEKLVGREQEVALLSNIWGSATANIAVLVAAGGVGKTALMCHWLTQMQTRGFRGAQMVYCWSFYAQDDSEQSQSSADMFFDDALRWFGYKGAAIKSAWDRGLKLAELIQKKRTLIVLDGLEPLQFPPGTMRGQLKDQGIRAMLLQLATNNPGLCLITSRAPVVELDTYNQVTVISHSLKNLSQEAGASLLRSIGVRSLDQNQNVSTKAFYDTVSEYHGNALALKLLGRYICYVLDGYIQSRHLVNELGLGIDEGNHAKRVMASYEKWLSETNELDLVVLYSIGLFDRPKKLSIFVRLQECLDISKIYKPGLPRSEEAWRFAVSRLEDLGLISIQGDGSNKVLDTHPIIRNYFKLRFKAEYRDVWIAVHQFLYRYYRDVLEKLSLDVGSVSLSALSPVFSAIYHGCQAGLHEEVFDVIYMPYISRGTEVYINRVLYSFELNLMTLSQFYEVRWSKSNVIDPVQQAHLMSITGTTLRPMGRMQEAAEVLSRAVELFREAEEFVQAAKTANTLSELHTTLCDLRMGVYHAKQCVEYADVSQSIYWQIKSRTTLADALHQSGLLIEAGSIQKQIAAIVFKLQSEDQEYLKKTYPLRGYRICDILISRGDFEEVERRTTKTLKETAPEKLSTFTEALAILQNSRAYGLRRSFLNVGAGRRREQAIEGLKQSVQLIRQSGRFDRLPRALLALCDQYIGALRVQRVSLGQTKKEILEILKECYRLSNDNSLFLHVVDCHIFSARYIIQFLEIDASVSLLSDDLQENTIDQHIDTAARLIEDYGYRRRLADLAVVRCWLGYLRKNKKDFENNKTLVRSYLKDGWMLHKRDWQIIQKLKVY